LNIVLFRRLKDGCDFGRGGGASGIGRDCKSESVCATRIARRAYAKLPCEMVDRAFRRAMFYFAAALHVFNIERRSARSTGYPGALLQRSDYLTSKIK
jgi:hypothetical protein